MLSQLKEKERERERQREEERESESGYFASGRLKTGRPTAESTNEKKEKVISSAKKPRE